MKWFIQNTKCVQKDIQDEAVFTKTEMNNEWNNFFKVQGKLKSTLRNINNMQLRVVNLQPVSIIIKFCTLEYCNIYL